MITKEDFSYDRQDYEYDDFQGRGFAVPVVTYLWRGHEVSLGLFRELLGELPEEEDE